MELRINRVRISRARPVILIHAGYVTDAPWNLNNVLRELKTNEITGIVFAKLIIHRKKGLWELGRVASI